MTDEEKRALEWDDEWNISEDEVMHRFREAVRISKEISRIKGKPTCEYDAEKGMAYMLYPDGHREYHTFDDDEVTNG